MDLLVSSHSFSFLPLHTIPWYHTRCFLSWPKISDHQSDWSGLFSGHFSRIDHGLLWNWSLSSSFLSLVGAYHWLRFIVILSFFVLKDASIISEAWVYTQLVFCVLLWATSAKLLVCVKFSSSWTEYTINSPNVFSVEIVSNKFN